MNGEPIAALATAPGLGGVAIIRLSGEGVYNIADRLTALRVPPSARKAGTFVHAPLLGAGGDVLDDALLLFFRAPHSYTGEDVIELHVHGGRVVPQAVLERLWALGARPARPGEFTQRAFLNGRLDLTQAEAVADLIAARSPRAERAARANLQGRLGAALSPLYEDTLTLSAEVEHLLDFDEGELPPDFFFAARDRLAALSDRTRALLATWHEGRLLREGALVVIAGKPNAGKSTLLNLLLGYGRAIVSDEPGTTRDSVEETFLLDGVPIRLVDTAGLRDAPGAVEREGVARARALLAQADAVLYLIATGDDDTPPPDAWVLRTKADLVGDRKDAGGVGRSALTGRSASCRADAPRTNLSAEAPQGASVKPQGGASGGRGREGVARPVSAQPEAQPVSSRISISATQAPEAAREAVCGLLREALRLGAGETDAATLANARQFAGLSAAETALEEAAAEFDKGEIGYVTAAQRLRAAAEALAEILGRTWSEDLLDRVFSSFCVGK